MSRRRFVRGASAAAVPALLAGASPSLLTACAGESGAGTGRAAGGALDRARLRGVITVGFANERPYGYINGSGSLVGAAPELARQIFRELGIPRVEGVQVSFSRLIAGLISRRYDAIAAGMAIIPERCASVAFADPDYCGKTAFLVPRGQKAGLTNFDSVAARPHVRLGVFAGSVEERQARAAGVRTSQIKTFADQVSAFDGLRSGHVHAIALTRVSLKALLERHKDAPYEVTDPFSRRIDGKESVGCGAFAFRKEDADLLDAWNAKLAQFKRDKRLLNILMWYGFTKGEEPSNHTSALFCGVAGAGASPEPTGSPGPTEPARG